MKIIVGRGPNLAAVGSFHRSQSTLIFKRVTLLIEPFKMGNMATLPGFQKIFISFDLTFDHVEEMFVKKFRFKNFV